MLNAPKFRINEPDIVSETIDGETVAVSLLTGAYYSLGGSAPQIWSLINQGLGIEQMTNALADEFKEDRSTIYEQVSEFIALLQTEALIVLDESEISPDEANKETLLDTELDTDPSQTYAPPELQKFDDMQELLLLDPIHEVDTQEGWPAAKTSVAASEG